MIAKTIGKKSNPASESALASHEIQNLYTCIRIQVEAACAIIDAASVLCALERAPEHQDAHSSFDIKTGGGFSAGRRVRDGTLPKMLEHASRLVHESVFDCDAMREKAIDALNGGVK